MFARYAVRVIGPFGKCGAPQRGSSKSVSVWHRSSVPTFTQVFRVVELIAIVALPTMPDLPPCLTKRRGRGESPSEAGEPKANRGPGGVQVEPRFIGMPPPVVPPWLGMPHLQMPRGAGGDWRQPLAASGTRRSISIRCEEDALTFVDFKDAEAEYGRDIGALDRPRAESRAALEDVSRVHAPNDATIESGGQPRGRAAPNRNRRGGRTRWPGRSTLARRKPRGAPGGTTMVAQGCRLPGEFGDLLRGSPGCH